MDDVREASRRDSWGDCVAFCVLVYFRFVSKATSTQNQIIVAFTQGIGEIELETTVEQTRLGSRLQCDGRLHRGFQARIKELKMS